VNLALRGTTIGRPFQDLRWPAAAVALTFTALDLLDAGAWASWSRFTPLALGVALLVGLAGGDRAGLGLRLRPVQGWGWWIKAALGLGAVVVGFGALAVGALSLAGRDPLVFPPGFSVADQLARLPFACLFSPAVEEGVYRLLLCAGLVALLRPWGAVVASGAIFAALHFRYGNPSPDNFIGGYLFAWAYLKSESLAVPVALHAVANLCATAINVAGWVLLRG
jgi:uncharacterized protein